MDVIAALFSKQRSRKVRESANSGIIKRIDSEDELCTSKKSSESSIFRRSPRRSLSLRLPRSGGSKSKISSTTTNKLNDLSVNQNCNGNSPSAGALQSQNASTRLVLTDQDLIVHVTTTESVAQNSTSLRRIVINERPNVTETLKTYTPGNAAAATAALFSPVGSFDSSSLTLSKYECFKRHHQQQQQQQSQHNKGASDGGSSDLSSTGSNSASQSTDHLLLSVSSSSSSPSQTIRTRPQPIHLSSKNCSHPSDINDCGDLKSGFSASGSSVEGEDEGINLVSSCNEDCPEEDCLDDEESSEDDFYWDFDDEDSPISTGASSTTTATAESCISTRQVFLTRPVSVGASLGLTIQGGAEFQLPVIIAAVRPSSPADLVGSVFAGDQILAVNGVTIDDSTSHSDALRLLAECGDSVTLVLRHSRCSSQLRRRWRWKKVVNTLNKHGANSESSTGENSSTSQLHQLESPHKTDSNRAASNHHQNHHSTLMQRSSSASCLAQYHRIDLFAAGVSRFISYSDETRHASLELRTASTQEPLIVQCASNDIAQHWFDAIRQTIDAQTGRYASFFNGHFPKDEHILFMGWIWERTPFQAKEFQQKFRWLPRYVVIKGGSVFLFKSPPLEALRSVRQRLYHLGHLRSVSNVNIGRRSTSSTNNSVVSVGIEHNNNNATSKTSISTKGRGDRTVRISTDLTRQLSQLATQEIHCYKSDFEIVKSGDLLDKRKHCLVVYSGAHNSKHYFATENRDYLLQFEAAWLRANFYSVFRQKNKTFTVQLENDEQQTFGSFSIDWRQGFAFFDPRTKSQLWVYQFQQLKYSQDDGQSLLLLTFGSYDNSSQVTHILRCSALMSLVYCINAFLAAKLYSLQCLQ